MRIRPVDQVPKLHVTPLAKVVVEDSTVRVEVDDEHEKRLILSFDVYQAVRITTADCFAQTYGAEVIPQTAVEIVESPWVDELRDSLRKVDRFATFMDKAKHYLIPAQDDYIEVVAWDLKCSPGQDTSVEEG